MKGIYEVRTLRWTTGGEALLSGGLGFNAYISRMNDGKFGLVCKSTMRNGILLEATATEANELMGKAQEAYEGFIAENVTLLVPEDLFVLMRCTVMEQNDEYVLVHITGGAEDTYIIICKLSHDVMYVEHYWEYIEPLWKGCCE